MITFANQLIKGLKPLDNLIKLVPMDDILFFDIETTGLSKANNQIYLIGCGYYSFEGLNIIQWFAENEQDEIEVLKSFISFSSSFRCLVNYNGKSFDIPFTSSRMEKYGLSMPSLNSIDLYTIVKPLKRLLSLNDLTQKSIESFLGIKRNDQFNGGELIPVYKEYVSLNKTLAHKKASLSSSEINILYEHISNNLKLLLLHNYEDVLNMHEIAKLFDYSKLCSDNIIFCNYKINDFKNYNGDHCKELIILGLHNESSVTKGFNSFKTTPVGSFIMTFSANGELKIRIPIVSNTFYYYLDNYKDYYYLPREDMCILKSMAGGVLKENRVNATKETCKIPLTSQFIPVYTDAKVENQSLRLFKESFKSKQNYITLDDFINSSEFIKTEYLKDLFNIFQK